MRGLLVGEGERDQARLAEGRAGEGDAERPIVLDLAGGRDQARRDADARIAGARGRIRWTLERAGGTGRIRLGRILAVAGICAALSASIAVGFYELLLRLEG